MQSHKRSLSDLPGRDALPGGDELAASVLHGLIDLLDEVFAVLRGGALELEGRCRELLLDRVGARVLNGKRRMEIRGLLPLLVVKVLGLKGEVLIEKVGSVLDRETRVWKLGWWL